MNRRPVVPPLFVVVAATNACGFLLSKGPPPNHQNLDYFHCTEGDIGPALDLVWAGLNLVGVLAIAADPDGYEETYGTDANAAMIISIGWTVGSTASGIAGFGKTRNCRAAKAELAQRQAGARSSLATGAAAAPAATAPRAVMLVQAVVLTPQSITLEVGQTQQVVAAAYHSSGVTIPDRTYTWSSSNDAIASVSNTGLVSANGVGVVTVAANTGNIVGTTRIQVVEPQR